MWRVARAFSPGRQRPGNSLRATRHEMKRAAFAALFISFYFLHAPSHFPEYLVVITCSPTVIFIEPSYESPS